eukprot:s1611_g14.t1
MLQDFLDLSVCAALEASFDDARREVEHQTRRRYTAEHALAAARSELGRLKAAYEAEQEGWQKREEHFRETLMTAEARAEQNALEAQEAQNELRNCREELAELRQARQAPHVPRAVQDIDGLSGGDIEAEVLELCQKLEEEAKALTFKLDFREGGDNGDASGRSWSTTSVGWSDRKKGFA